MTEQWLIDHEQRRADGTYKRIDAAIKNRTPVQIKRSSGETVTGYAASNPGVIVVVVWGDGAENWRLDGDKIRVEPGVMSKPVKTEDLVSWNPWLAGGG